MTNSKKIFAMLLAASFVGAGFTGCGSSDSETAEEATTVAEETTAAEEETTAEDTRSVASDITGFEPAVVPESGQAYLSMTDGQWWLTYFGSDADYLTYGAGVADITGNGQYTVSVTIDTNACRFDTTGDENGDLLASGTAFMAVQIMDGADVCPNAVISIDNVEVDNAGTKTELELTKKSYTNTEDAEIDGTTHHNIRSNIFNEWVSDGSLPDDARCADGAVADQADAADYSATIIDPSAVLDWTTITVTFTVSGM